MRMHVRPALSALGAVLAFSACGGEPPERAGPAPLEIGGTAFVVRDTLVVDVFEAAGVAEPVQRAMLASKLMARVTEVLVQEGDRVGAGQVLARLDARDLSARAEQAAAGLTGAEAGYQEALAQAHRIRALYADSAAPRAQLDQVEAGLARAEAALRQARAAGAELEAVSDYATIRAPFAGVITQRLLDPGGFAAPGEPLLSIEDQSSLRLSVTAAPEAVGRLRRGQRIAGAVAGLPVEAVIEGVVSATGGHLVTVNAMVRNRDRVAFAGSAATLALPQGTRTSLLLPRRALIREGDLTGVRLRRGNTAELRWIRVGGMHAAMVEVLSGLVDGDTVIVRDGVD